MSVDALKHIIDSSNSIVFFGGAGVSTESAIPDFRSDNGLYKIKNSSYSPEDILTHSFFMNHSEDFYKFYKEKMVYAEAVPNAAHYALAKLEELGKLKTVITQNIDGLHQMAGSKNVLELHGSIHKNYCMECGKTFTLDYIMTSKDIAPRCSDCDEIVRPDVVLYEEALDEDVIYNAVNAIRSADVLIVGGTSLVVYPAAGLIRYFKGKDLVLINKASTSYDSMASIVINDSIGEVLSEVLYGL